MTIPGGLRTLSGWSIGLSALLTAACTSSSGSGQENQGLPADCTATVTRSSDVRQALDSAMPGSLVCFTGGNLTDADLQMTKSGTADSPIKLMADGATVDNIHVTANYVLVEGFTVSGGDGILLEGTGITAQRNTIHDTRRGGVACIPCTDSTITANTVQHVATAGIYISGQRITVSGNTVSDTIAVDDGDADGMRFFGTGHRITGNTIRNISDRGYRAPPHPDCFQTFDTGPGAPVADSGPSRHVLIEDNRCERVEESCLVAQGPHSRAGTGGGAGETSDIAFTGNYCEAHYVQAVLFDDVRQGSATDNEIACT
ncbi:MAG: right-handed parallel beta-helix repeat-containing protein, partial [Candidatus Dormibacteria bacterium]